VDDNCAALELVLADGVDGTIYNVGAGNEIHNLDLTQRLLGLCGADASSIEYVADRPGHDRRYSVDTSRIRALGWAPVRDLDDGLAETVAWYRDNADWWEPLLEEKS
jgi:dTDP-glucose 4,6-dehydratase